MEEPKKKRKSNTTANKSGSAEKKTTARKSATKNAASTKKTSATTRPTSRQRIAVQKKYALKVLRKNFGNVTLTCDAIGISRFEVYKWRKDDPEFNNAVEEINEVSLDMVEGVMMKAILEDGNARLIMFYLNSKGKKRGYGLKNESDGDKSGAVLLNISPDEAEY